MKGEAVLFALTQKSACLCLFYLFFKINMKAVRSSLQQEANPVSLLD
jgi:hypothetical protein